MAPENLPGMEDSLNRHELVHSIAVALAEEAKRAGRSMCFMEVCGTHTVAIARGGLCAMLPESIKLISGPGCPVCVTSARDIDRAIAVAMIKGAVAVSFGDMLRVPGSLGSLETARESGGEAAVVYSPLDALALARENPSKNVVFLGVGFETTAPAIAATVLEAQSSGVNNFFVLPMLKTVPPALAALLSDPQCAVDGFLLPGHVSAIIGLEPYRTVLGRHKRPGVIAGFEAADILHGLRLLARACADGCYDVENAYPRAVRPEGNPVAADMVVKVFEPCDAQWRGLGMIPASGLRFRKEFERFDAGTVFGLDVPETEEPAGCICGRVLAGKASPEDCALFGGACTPSTPVGPCMVSSEGSCAASYNYGK